jgi:hypothetical protein
MSDGRPWRERLEDLGKPFERAYLERVEAVSKSTAPVTLLPNELRPRDACASLQCIGIMVGEHEVGMLQVSGRADGILWIDKIDVYRDLNMRGYGKSALALLRTLARKEKYLRLAGEVEPGKPEVVRGRRIFFGKCGFIVNEDRSMEMDLTVTAS